MSVVSPAIVAGCVDPEEIIGTWAALLVGLVTTVYVAALGIDRLVRKHSVRRSHGFPAVPSEDRPVE